MQRLPRGRESPPRWPGKSHSAPSCSKNRSRYADNGSHTNKAQPQPDQDIVPWRPNQLRSQRMSSPQQRDPWVKYEPPISWDVRRPPTNFHISNAHQDSTSRWHIISYWYLYWYWYSYWYDFIFIFTLVFIIIHLFSYWINCLSIYLLSIYVFFTILHIVGCILVPTALSMQQRANYLKPSRRTWPSE